MTYFQEFKPVGHVGFSIWLYELSEEDILKSQSWGSVYRSYLDHKAGKVREADGMTSLERLSVLGTCQSFDWSEVQAKKLIHRTTQGRWGLSVLDFAVGS